MRWSPTGSPGGAAERPGGLVEDLVAVELARLQFGVEITTEKDPRVHRVIDEEGAETEPLDPQTFGTRHRSMMRYCFANPNASGLLSPRIARFVP
jgi:hypothetical protein